MTAAYRTDPSSVRHDLLRRRDALLRRPTDEVDPRARAELEELAAALDHADRDPIDHVRAQLRRYELALVAGKEAGRQSQHRRGRGAVARR